MNRALIIKTAKDILLIFIKQTYLRGWEGGSAVQRFGALVSGRSRNLPAPLTTTKYTVHCHQHQHRKPVRFDVYDC